MTADADANVDLKTGAKPDASARDRDSTAMIRKLNVVGLAMVVVFVGCIGGWAATSELAGAVIAAGTVIVESVDKKVQHPTGGVVKDILVHDGSEVEEGQVLLRLDDTVPRATLGVLRSQFDENSARRARLLAEREGADSIAFPQDLTTRMDQTNVAVALSGEEKLFDSRKAARTGQRAQLRERISQSDEEIRGLGAQQQAKENEINLVSEELVGVSDLYKKNLVSISRYMQLRREQTRLQGQRGQFIADIARARAKISETELQIIQLDQDFRTEVLKDLRDTEGKIAELVERMVAAEDQLRRIDIRAPRSGVVHSLAIHTIGGVIGNGETIMSIVPRGDELIVEAKVAPSEVDQIGLGASTVVRINAGNQRTMPELNGIVIHVSADLTRDQPSVAGPGQAYYLVRVSLPKAQVERLAEFRLLPGMPAEIFIQTYARTPLQYLLKPLREQIARTFRER
jgi:membrane fusion protein, type I secretion system